MIENEGDILKSYIQQAAKKKIMIETQINTQEIKHSEQQTTYSRISIYRTRIFEFCEFRSVYLNQKYILIAFSNNDLALRT